MKMCMEKLEELVEKLSNLVKDKRAKTTPATLKEISELSDKLKFSLSTDYKSFLATFGTISYKSNEVYGLGVPENSYLNVLDKYEDLSKDKSYPQKCVPLLEIGDGHYALYDNSTGKVLIWATPNGGIVKKTNDDLEDYLIKTLF